MSLPKGNEVEAQASSPGATPSPTPAPCPSGDVPKEGSRDIQGKGKIISVPHDWCKSTDSPVPYKIWAWQSSASNLANSVRQTDCRSHVLGSIVNQCYGDEPGTGGGVKSGTNLAECTPLSASPTVRAEGKPMVRYLDKWWMNHKNTWGCLNNSEDMGRYDPPKLQSIDAKLSPIPSREEDQASAAGGTKVAQADVIVEEGSQIISPVLAGSAAAAGVIVGSIHNIPKGLGPPMVLSPHLTGSLLNYVLQKTGIVRVTRDPGKCTPEQYSKYEELKDAACYNLRACRTGDSAAVITSKLNTQYNCMRARQRIMDACFEGGDKGHKQAVSQILTMIGNCRGMYK